MMKKALLLLLSLILCFTLVACGENNTPVEENNDNVNLPNEEINDISIKINRIWYYKIIKSGAIFTLK